MRATGVDRERRAEITAPAGHPARASQRCPVRRQRRRARLVNVWGVLPEVLPVEERALRPLGPEFFEVLVEGADAALPDHFDLGHRAGGGFPHPGQLGLGLAVDDRHAGDVPGTGSASLTVGQRGLGIRPREGRGEGRTRSRSFVVMVNARIVQPALSMERTTTLAPTR